MTNRIHYTSCPVCGSAEITKKLSVPDFTVSGEIFPVFHCRSCTLRFTQDIPDAASIGRFYKSEDYISHSNSSKGLINILYQRVRKIALRGKRKMIESLSAGKKGNLLDVGSGTGSFVAEMKKNGWTVTGLEPDPGARKIAEETNQVRLLSAEEINQLPAGHFDIITLWHVLEHLHDLQPSIRQFRSLLKPGGKIIVAVPNYTSLDAEIYKQFWAAYDVPRHLYHFSPDSMRRLMDNQGLKIQSIRPMWFDSYYVSLLSSRYQYRSVRWVSALWVGFRSNLQALVRKEKCSSLIYIIG